MKFLQSHHKDVLQKIDQSSWSLQVFSFKKTRGRIHIIQNESKEFFSYIRKVQPILTESQQFEKGAIYKIKQTGQKERIVEDWAAVLKAFESWLIELKTKN